MHLLKMHNGNNVLNKIILVVEDDASIGTLLVDALTEETGYSIVLVPDGRQALDAIHRIRPCLFITDYCLPSMNGIELCDRIRASKEVRDTPVILMSAQLPEEDVKKRHLSSLSKPFELDDLLDTVEKALAS